MTENPSRSQVRIVQVERPASEGRPCNDKRIADRGSGTALAVVVLCCATIALGGCAAQKRPNIPWATAIQVKPVVQAHNAGTGDAPEDFGSELQLDLPTFPSRLIPLRTAPPPRPRINTPPPAGTGSDTEKSETPLIAPQLTPQESAVAQQQTNQSLSIAEKNLASARGRTLNAAQSDLVSKIRGFIKDAREAARIADWSRARSLAKKAQVLSEELAGSL
ncbi:MAG TPA: hypothetical protein VJO16_19410 [Candidatus Acidoferrum sp.]|nr:hypothetical protein [Candidatus Acidoferrum sp.]